LNTESLKIIYYPDPILKKRALPIKQITPEIHELTEKMIKLMVQAHGIGLAAPQVSVGLRLFIVSLTSDAQDVQVYINPQLSDFQGLSEIQEGCLSLPGVQLNITRPATCLVTAQDLTGETFSFQAQELEASVIQHENDHLDGRLIIDRTTILQRMACRKTIKQLERDFQS
jgi:peptide deformylase